MPDRFEIIDVPGEAPSDPEAMGTKRKFWYDDARFGRALFKHARSETGEDWAEKIAAELCSRLGLPHARYELADWGGHKGTISVNFLPENASLVPGNELIFGIQPTYNRTSTFNAADHTVLMVEKALLNYGAKPPPEADLPSGVRTASDVFLGYLMLDAWIGNTDRHH